MLANFSMKNFRKCIFSKFDFFNVSFTVFQFDWKTIFITPQSKIRLSMPVKRVENRVFYSREESDKSMQMAVSFCPLAHLHMLCFILFLFLSILDHHNVSIIARLVLKQTSIYFECVVSCNWGYIYFNSFEFEFEFWSWSWRGPESPLTL